MQCSTKERYYPTIPIGQQTQTSQYLGSLTSLGALEMNDKASQGIKVSVAGLVFDPSNKVFAAKRGSQSRNERGFWEFPGGQVEWGEPLMEALKREFMEEFGIGIRPEKIFGVYESISDENNEHWVTIVFTATYISGEPKILEPEKCADIGWFGINDLPKPLTELTQKEVTDYTNKP